MEPLLNEKNKFEPEIREKCPRELILHHITIEKLFAQPTLIFLKSLKLRNFSEESLSKYSREIGAFIYFFRIVNKKTSECWIIRRSFKELVLLYKNIKKEAKRYKKKIKTPALPFTKDKPQDIPDQNLTFFDVYLNLLINNHETHVFECLSLFLEVSEVENEGNFQKYKEVYVHKRAGGRYNENQLILRCGAFCRCWNKRYMIISSEGVMYSKGHLKADSFIRENLLFDHHFKLEYGKQETGLSKGLNLIYSNRKLHIEALDLFSFFDILASLNEAFVHSPYIVENRFKSFAPVRDSTFCKYYIDGEEYFHDVCDALLSAQSEVFITDWWLSPELHLKRPVSLTKNTYTRIDRVLKSIAENGVLVKIIVYNEPKIALTIDSEHTQTSLQNLHHNIAVLRHPGYLLPTFLWSHHEKMIVIDQELGFLGGLDLCYGRMDTHDHHLFDHTQYEVLKGEEISLNLSENEEFFPGIDYSNSRKRDFVNVRNFEKPLISKKDEPRMPWHDIGVRIMGEAVADMTRHFIQYWNFAKFNLEPTVKKKKLFTKGKINDSQKIGMEMENQDKNYLDKMKRKWTKFKMDLGITGKDKDKKSLNGSKISQNDEEINFDKKQKTDVLEPFEEKKTEANPKFAFKSDFVPRKSPIGNTFYDIYAPKKYISEKSSNPDSLKSKENNQEEEEVKENKENESENKNDIDPSFSNNSFKDARNNAKKNSYKARNFIKSIANSRPSEYFREAMMSTRIRSVSQSERNRIDNFEKNPKFMMLLKEVQQVKIEMEEKADEDYMKTTKELESDKNGNDFIQTSNIGKFIGESMINKEENFQKKPTTKLNKLKSFFTRDAKEIENARQKKIVYDQKKLVKNSSLKSSLVDSDKIALKDDTIKFHYGKKHIESGKVKCQMLRSASLWSLGLKKENYENSIYIAYLALITNAENFIYIENQFFISSTAGAPVKNKIAEALIARIKKAAAENQVFKVIIVMPLLPGFEGEINEANSAVLKVQLHYEFLTLSRGGQSILEELSKDPNIPDPYQYISVYGLRNHALMPNNKPVTEIIYVHSKLLIVDDLFVIIGSANINDRSMLGNRDSEIAMLIEDNNLIPSRMNGLFAKVSKFAQSLRVKLFMEHFGLSMEELQDPLNQEILAKIDNNAKRNAEIYREVFRCYPDDEISIISEYDKLSKFGNIEKYEELKKEIVGHAVSFPLKFLEKEDLQLRLKNKEYYIPNHNFT